MPIFHLLKIFPLLVFLFLPAGSINAQSDLGIEYLRYDVDITLDKRGDFIVRETQQVRYGDELSEGFAEIPLEYATDITGIAVYGGPDVDHLNPYKFNEIGPDTFSLDREGDTLYVDWEYVPTQAGDELTFGSNM